MQGAVSKLIAGPMVSKLVEMMPTPVDRPLTPNGLGQLHRVPDLVLGEDPGIGKLMQIFEQQVRLVVLRRSLDMFLRQVVRSVSAPTQIQARLCPPCFGHSCVACV